MLYYFTQPKPIKGTETHDHVGNVFGFSDFTQPKPIEGTETVDAGHLSTLEREAVETLRSADKETQKKIVKAMKALV